MPSHLSAGVLLLLAALQPCLAAGTGTGAGTGATSNTGVYDTYRGTKFGDWKFLTERGAGSDVGYTWFARVPLWVPENTGAPTVALMEEYAKVAYQLIANDRGRRIMKNGQNTGQNNGQNNDKDTKLFGAGNSEDFAMSAYSHKGARYVWISSIPRGNGQKIAKGRIVGSTERRQAISDGDKTVGQANLLKGVLMDKATASKGKNKMSIDVFAEESAFSLFETDKEFQTDPQYHNKYPPGSVVGTWHRGPTISGQLASVGKRANVCTEEDTPPKDNKRCIGATRALGVAARFDGMADDEDPSHHYLANPAPPCHSYGRNGRHRRGVPGKGGAKDGTKGDGDDACALPDSKTTGAAGNKGATPTTMKTMRSKPTGTGAKNQKPSHSPAATGTHDKPAKKGDGKPTGASKGATDKTGGNTKAGSSKAGKDNN